MAAPESLITWVSLFEDARKIETAFSDDDYQDLNQDFVALQAKVMQSGTISAEEDVVFESIIKTYYRRAISNRYRALRSLIETRKTRGEAFASYLRKAERTRKNGEKDCDIAQLHDIHLDMVEIEEEIKEKIEIERYQFRQQLMFTFIGAIIGFFLGLLTVIII